jgi:hypothetical protein
VARFAARHLHKLVVQSERFQAGDVATALRDTYLRVDEVLVTPAGREELAALENSDSSEDEGGEMAFLQQLEGLEGVEVDSRAARGGGAGAEGGDGDGEEEDGDMDTVVEAIPGANGLRVVLRRVPRSQEGQKKETGATALVLGGGEGAAAAAAGPAPEFPPGSYESPNKAASPEGEVADDDGEMVVRGSVSQPPPGGGRARAGAIFWTTCPSTRALTPGARRWWRWCTATRCTWRTRATRGAC